MEIIWCMQFILLISWILPHILPMRQFLSPSKQAGAFFLAIIVIISVALCFGLFFDIVRVFSWYFDLLLVTILLPFCIYIISWTMYFYHDNHRILKWNFINDKSLKQSAFPFKEVSRLLDERQYINAHSVLLNASHNGNAIAQYNVGLMYEIGLPYKSDYEAENWYRKASYAGLSCAQYELAKLLAAPIMAHGPNVRDLRSGKKLTEAAMWLIVSSRKSHTLSWRGYYGIKKHLSVNEMGLAKICADGNMQQFETKWREYENHVSRTLATVQDVGEASANIWGAGLARQSRHHLEDRGAQRPEHNVDDIQGGEHTVLQELERQNENKRELLGALLPATLGVYLFFILPVFLFLWIDEKLGVIEIVIMILVAIINAFLSMF